MAIPQHVKQQAMDAVNHRETTAMIRSAKDSGISVSPENLFTHRQEPRPENRPIPDDVKRQAMDSISHPEMSNQIRLATYNGVVTPPVTPMRDVDRSAERVNKLFEVNPGMQSPQQTMTRDGFGRE